MEWRDGEGREWWSDGGGKGGVVESDGGEREEWEGWGLMEGGECRWAIVVHVRARRPVQGHSLCVGGVSSLSKGARLSSMGGGHLVVMCGWHVVTVSGRRVVVRGWESSGHHDERRHRRRSQRHGTCTCTPPILPLPL